MSRLDDVFSEPYMVLLDILLAAAFFIFGVACGIGYAVHNPATTGDEHSAPTTICEPLPDDSGRWRCHDASEAKQ